MHNYYQLLNIKPTATDSEIKKSYRHLAIKYHPDSGSTDSGSRNFELITEAYKTLMDSDSRRRYDYLLFYKDRLEATSKNNAIKNIKIHPSEEDEPEGKNFFKKLKESQYIDFLIRFLLNYAPIVGLLYMIKFQNYIALVPITLLCNFVFLIDENSIKEESKDNLFILRGVFLSAVVALLSVEILSRAGLYNRSLVIFLVGISVIFSGFTNRSIFDLRILKIILFSVILYMAYTFLPSKV
jgi:hypothetical protein